MSSSITIEDHVAHLDRHLESSLPVPSPLCITCNPSLDTSVPIGTLGLDRLVRFPADHPMAGQLAFIDTWPPTGMGVNVQLIEDRSFRMVPSLTRVLVVDGKTL